MDLKKINKRLFLYLGIVLGVIIIIMLVLVFMNGGTKLSYEQLEKKLRESAIDYYKDNKDLLPEKDGEQVSVSAFDLEEGKYIGKLQEMVRGDAICSGEVKVTKNGDNYMYVPYLICGNEYASTELYKVITDGNVVTEGDGLYKLNNEYVYRGEKVNNYVKFADKLWRIVKVDQPNDIKLILDDYEKRSVWDDRYNTERGYESGINNYVNDNLPSRIKDALYSLYNDNKYFSDVERGKIAYKNICIGKRKIESDVNNGSVECASLLKNQPISMLRANEYLNASLDENCKKTDDESCKNYNYLANYEKSWWSITADANNTYKVYKFTTDGIIVSNASSTSAIKPVIYLSSFVMYDKGDGSLENPYLIK